MLDPTPAAQPLRPPGPDELTVVEARYDSDLARELVEELQGEYVLRYGGEDETPVDPEEFTAPHGAFLVATVGGLPVGSVAMRRHVPDAPGAGPWNADDGLAVEVKRLYVRAGHRRRGYARQVVRLAEERARALGYRRVVLETGTEQPEAMALYASEGYVPIPRYGHYRCAPRSRCFGKEL